MGAMRTILLLGYFCSCCLAQTPALVQHTSSGRDNTLGYNNPTYRFFLPNPTLAGNCLILRFEHDSELTTSSVITDQGDTFSSGPSIDTGGHVIESFYVAASTGSQIISVATAGSVESNVNGASGDLSEFYDTSCIVDASGSSSSRSVTLSPAAANDLIWQSGDDTSSFSPSTTGMTVGSGYTMLQGNVSQGTFGQYKTGAAAGTQTISFQTSDGDLWQSVAIAFKSAFAGTAPPSTGIRVVNMYGEIFGDKTHTMYVPCSGNLLVGMWSSPAVTISAISSSPSGTWSKGASSDFGGALFSQVFYGQGMNCNSTLTMTPTYSGASSGGLNFLVMLDVAGADASAHDVDQTNTGDQTSGVTLATDTITPTTANGLILDSTAWWGCTAVSASPGIFAGIATNSGNSDVCAPTRTANSTLNEDNGLALYYNPNTAPVTFKYKDTGSVQQWASVASAFKSGGTTSGVSGVACNPVSLSPSAISTCTVTLTQAAPAGGSSVALTSNSISLTVPSSVTVAAGAPTATFSATAATSIASNQSVTLTATLGSSSQTATINLLAPGSVLVSSVTCSPTSVRPGGVSTCTVMLTQSAPAGGSSVTLASDNTLLAVPASVTVAAGAATATFSATAAAAFTSNQTAIVTATLGSSSSTATITGATVTTAAPSFIQEKDNRVTSGTTSSATFSSPTTAGNLIVVYLIWDNTGAAAVSDSLGNKYAAAIGSKLWSNSHYTVQTFYAINSIGGTDTVTATFATAVNSFGIVYADEYSGVAQTAPIDVTAAAAGASGSLNSGTVTTTSSTDLLFAGGASANIVTSPGAGYTARSTFEGNLTEDRVVSAKGSYSATANNSGGAWAMQMVAFRGAAASGTVLVSGVTCSPASLGPGGISTCTVTLTQNALPGGSSVTLASNNGLLTVPALVTVAAGAATATFSATAAAGIASNQSATVTATLGASSLTSTITLIAPILVSALACNPTNLSPGGISTCTVTLTQSAPAGGLSVTLASNNTLLTVPASVTTAAGATTATFSATAAAAFTSSQSATVTATLGSSSNAATITGAPVTSALPSFIQENNNQAISGTTSSATFSSATSAGNLIVVYVIWDNTGTAAVSDSLGNTYTAAVGSTLWNNSQYSIQTFYAINRSGGANTVTVRFATAINSFGIVYADEYSGVAQTAPIDVTAAAAGASGSLNSGTVTTTNSTDLLFAGGASANMVTGPGAGYTARSTFAGNMTEDQVVSAKGSYSATASNSSGVAWAMQLVAFKAAAGGTGGANLVSALARTGLQP
jgi:trimeric autotransporter adhesin